MSSDDQKQELQRTEIDGSRSSVEEVVDSSLPNATASSTCPSTTSTSTCSASASNLLRDFPRSPEGTCQGTVTSTIDASAAPRGVLLRDFSTDSIIVSSIGTDAVSASSEVAPPHAGNPTDNSRTTGNITTAAKSSSIHQSKRKVSGGRTRRPSPTPHQATTCQSLGTKGLNSYRPSGSNSDIAVCLYGPSRLYFGQFLETSTVEAHIAEAASTALHDSILLPATTNDPKQQEGQGQKTEADTDTDHHDNYTSTGTHENNHGGDDLIDALTNSLPLQKNEEEDTAMEETTLQPNDDDAVSNDPRWTGKDGFPRLAPRFDYGLADVGSLTSKRRILSSQTKDASAKQRMPSFDQDDQQQKQDTVTSAGTDRPQIYSLQSPPQHIIDIQALRRIASQGISDIGSHRPVAWRVLLGYLPTHLSDWGQKLKNDRQLYRNLVAELFVKPVVDDAGRHKSRSKVFKGVVPISYSESNISEADANTDDLQQKLQHVSVSQGITSSTVENCHDSNLLHPQNTKELTCLTSGPLDDAAANRKNKQLTSKNSPVPVAYSPSANQEGFAALVPARIREQWKQEGRDGIVQSHIQRLSVGSTENNDAAMISDQHTNTLLVVDDQGCAPGDNQRISINNDPLNSSEDSKWQQFYENAALLDEVRKDVVRTHPDLHFFLEPDENLGQRRYAALERILFVWAKLNRGVKYVQGMNEIVGTIYYVLANDFNEEWAAEAEADSYFLFNIIVTEMRDVFVPDLDTADTGIQGRILNMMQLLSLHDPEVRCHLDDIGIDPTFYSIRWLTTLLSREFTLPDTIRLWDSMFASTHKENFLRYVCVTMVMMIRDQLLEGDFSVCLRLLQSYPPTNVDRMLESSRALWIYESQITLACHKSGIGLGQALSFLEPPPGVIMAYGLKRGKTDTAGKRVERGLLIAKDVAEETASSARKLLGNAAKTVSEWTKRRAEAKEAKKREDEITIFL